MTKELRDILLVALVFISNFAMLAGTAYVVFWKDASAWWFLIPLFAMRSVSLSESKD